MQWNSCECLGIWVFLYRAFSLSHKSVSRWPNWWCFGDQWRRSPLTVSRIRVKIDQHFLVQNPDYVVNEGDDNNDDTVIKTTTTTTATMMFVKTNPDILDGANAPRTQTIDIVRLDLLTHSQHPPAANPPPSHRQKIEHTNTALYKSITSSRAGNYQSQPADPHTRKHTKRRLTSAARLLFFFIWRYIARRSQLCNLTTEY